MDKRCVTEGVDTGFVALGEVKVAILGVCRGITELMPISSPLICGWCRQSWAGQDPGSAFSATMRLAALDAVVCYFWSDIRSITGGSIAAMRAGDVGITNSEWWLRCHRRRSSPSSIAGLLLAPLLNRCDSPCAACR